MFQERGKNARKKLDGLSARCIARLSYLWLNFFDSAPILNGLKTLIENLLFKNISKRKIESILNSI